MLQLLAILACNDHQLKIAGIKNFLLALWTFVKNIFEFFEKAANEIARPTTNER